MNPQKHCSFCPLPSRGMDRRDNGANSHESEFLHTTKLLLENYPSFTLQDCIALTRGLDLPPGEVKKLFDSWTTGLVRSGRLKAIEGAYNDQIFLVETV